MLRPKVSSKQSPVTPLKPSPRSGTSIFGRSVSSASNQATASSAASKKAPSPRPQRYVPSPTTMDTRGAFLTPRNRRAIRELLLPVRGMISHVRGISTKLQQQQQQRYRSIESHRIESVKCTSVRVNMHLISMDSILRYSANRGRPRSWCVSSVPTATACTRIG